MVKLFSIYVNRRVFLMIEEVTKVVSLCQKYRKLYQAYPIALRGVHLVDFSKGHNFCNFLFAFKQANIVLKMDLIYKEKKVPRGSKFFPYRLDPFQKGR